MIEKKQITYQDILQKTLEQVSYSHRFDEIIDKYGEQLLRLGYDTAMQVKVPNDLLMDLPKCVRHYCMNFAGQALDVQRGFLTYMAGGFRYGESVFAKYLKDKPLTHCLKGHEMTTIKHTDLIVKNSDYTQGYQCDACGKKYQGGILLHCESCVIPRQGGYDICKHCAHFE
jgi:hypothetical protein